MENDPAPLQHLPQPADRVWRQFLAALDELPAEARAVLLLHEVFGIDIEHTAAALGLPAAACRQRLQRAQACLRAHARQLEPKTP